MSAQKLNDVPTRIGLEWAGHFSFIQAADHIGDSGTVGLNFKPTHVEIMSDEAFLKGKIGTYEVR